MILRKTYFSGSIIISILSCSFPSFSTQTTHDCSWDCPIPPANSQQYEEPILAKLSNSASKAAASSSYKNVKRKVVMKRHPELEFFAGGGWIRESTSQFVLIDGLIGDNFSVSQPSKAHGLIGLALDIDGPDIETEQFKLQYQISSVFVPNSAVNGLVTQEKLVTNLSYAYNVYSIASFLGLKATSKPFARNFYLTGDLGLGFNYIFSKQFREFMLVPYAVPDNIFAYTSNKEIDFAVSTGIGIKIKILVPKMYLTAGYRFLYLGQGSLPSTNTLVHTSLQTGYGYFNAITGGFIYAFG